MIITRNASAYRSLQANLSKNSTTLNQLYIKTSTGLEVAKASDAPAAVAEIINGRSDMVKGQRYVANCQHVQDSLANAEIAIDAVEALMTRAKEIAVAGANDSLSASDRSTLANEVSQLQESLLDLANTEVNGKYLFAGYNDQTLPFSGSPVGYNGTDDHQLIEISPGTTVAKNITGEELFLSPINLFTTLEELTTALNSADTAACSSQLTGLEQAADQVRGQQSLLGNTSARMDDMISLHQNTLLLVEASLADNQDADLAAVLSEIAQMELSLEATMQVTARVSSLNLMDYL